MGVIAEGIPRGCQGLFTPVSLGYPLSVFNKNSALERMKFETERTMTNEERTMYITKTGGSWLIKNKNWRVLVNRVLAIHLVQ